MSSILRFVWVCGRCEMKHIRFRRALINKLIKITLNACRSQLKISWADFKIETSPAYSKRQKVVKDVKSVTRATAHQTKQRTLNEFCSEDCLSTSFKQMLGLETKSWHLNYFALLLNTNVMRNLWTVLGNQARLFSWYTPWYKTCQFRREGTNSRGARD